MIRWILLVWILILCVLCPFVGVPALVVFIVIDFFQTVIKWGKKIFK